MSIGKIILLAIAAIIASALIPTAVHQWVTANQTNWTDTDIAVWAVGSVIIILAIIWGFVKSGGLIKG